MGREQRPPDGGHGVYPIIDDADPYGVGSGGPALQVLKTSQESRSNKTDSTDKGS